MGRGGGGTANPVDPVLAVTVASNRTSAGSGYQIITRGTITLAGGPNITLSQDGNAITISGGAGGAGGGINLAASNTTYTSGTITLTGVGGGVTVSSNTGQRIDISVAAPVAQTVQTQNLHNVTLSGNTAGAMAQVSSGTLTLAGGNNITLSQAGNAITISGAAAGGAQTGISGIAASNTTYTSGSVTFSGVGGGITVSSNTGQRIDLSVAAPVAQTVQTQNVVVPAGSNTTYTSGTVVFTGSNAVTVRSTTGQAIVIDAPTQTVQTQGGFASMGVSTGGNTAGNTTVNTGSRMVFVASGGITASQDTAAGASTINLSVPAGASATGNLGSIAWSNTTVSAGGLTITGSNAATVKSAVGPQVVIDVPVQTLQTQSRFNLTLSGNSTSGGGGFIQISSGVMTLAGGNNVTLSQDGNAVTISGAAAGGAQTAISGIVASNATYTSGTVSFSGFGGGITVQSNTGQRIDLSVAAPVAQTVQPGIAGVIAGTQTLTTGTLSFINGSGVSFGLNSGASTSQLTASVAAGATATGNLGSIAWSNTTVSAGGLTITGSNAATVKSGVGPNVVIDVPVQTVQTQNVVVPAGSNTTYTSGTVVFSGSNAVTVRSTTGQAIIIDSPVQTVQTQSRFNLTLSGNSTSGGGGYILISSGVMALAGGPNITLSQDGQSVSVSAGAGGGFSAGVSTGGNTAGSTGVSGTRVVLVGSNNMTLSQSTDANGATVSFLAPSPGAAAYSIGVSTGGNTAGATGVTGTRIVFVGTPNITLSQANDATGATISMSGNPAFSAGVSNLGNTSGSTALTGSQMVLAGGNNITLSQSTGANGATVSVSGAASWSIPSFSYWDNAAAAGTASAQLTSVGTAHRSFYFFPVHQLNDCFPGNMTVSTLRLDFSGSQAATTSTLAYTLSMYGGLYTMNGSSLSLLNSFSASVGSNANNASISSHLQGLRWFTVHSSQWSAQPTLSQTNYWMGVAFSSSGEAKGVSSMVFRGPTNGSAIRSGEVGGAFATGSSTMLHQAWAGVYTATSASPPTSLSKGHLAIPANTLSAGAIPHIVFDNLGILQ